MLTANNVTSALQC